MIGIKGEDQQELNRFLGESNAAEFHWPGRIEISSDEDADLAEGAIRELKAKREEIEDWRKEVVGPMKKAIRAFEDKVRPAVKRYKTLEERTRAAVSAYLTAQANAREEAHKQLAAGGPVPEIVETPREGKQATYWKLEVVDFAALPDDYKIADDAALKKACKEGTEVPGTKLVREVRMRL